jgi:hypothetical protein
MTPIGPYKDKSKIPTLRRQRSGWGTRKSQTLGHTTRRRAFARRDPMTPIGRYRGKSAQAEAGRVRTASRRDPCLRQAGFAALRMTA